MSYTVTQSALTLAIEVVALSSLFGFSAAFAAELVAGFFRYRAQLAQPAAEISEVLVQSSEELGELIEAYEDDADVTAAEGQTVEVTDEELAEFQEQSKGQVVQLFAATEATDRQADMMLQRSLEAMSVKALRRWATNEKIQGRSAWKTKKQLIAGIAEYEAKRRFEAKLAS